MSSELMLRQANTLPMQGVADFKFVGDLLAQTKLFGTNNPAEGFAIACMCHQDGVSFSQWMQSNHMIMGKVSKRADTMLADFEKKGGDYVIVAKTAEVGTIELKIGNRTYISTLTWEEALCEPFVYNGKEEEVVAALSTEKGRATLREKFIKPKYSTPRARMQMLWARAVSDGVRTVCPSACCGTYTPEETADFAGEEQPTKVITPTEAGKRAGKSARKPTMIESEAQEIPSVPEPAPTPAECENEPPPETEPTPISPEPVTEAEPVEEDEFLRCPDIPAFSARGKAWVEVDTAVLKKAYGSKHPALTAMHLSAIRSELAHRGEEP